MTDAQRIWDDEEKLLFSAGRAEVPPAGSAAGVLAALGLEGPVGDPSGGEEAPVSGLSPVPVPVAPPAPVSGIFARPATWIGIGGALLVLVPAAMSLSGGSDEGSSEQSPAPAAERAEAQVEAPAIPAPLEAPAIAGDELAEEEEAIEAEKAAPAVSGSLAPSGDTSAARPSLAEELAVIKQARASLNAGNLAAAEEALGIHQKKFTPARLATEARVLRVEILVKKGQMAQARQLAAPLMKENSPYRARMEKLLSSP